MDGCFGVGDYGVFMLVTKAQAIPSALQFVLAGNWVQ